MPNSPNQPLNAMPGPSGSGKTTLLNTLAHRAAAAGATTHGDILANGQPVSWQELRHLSAYVEQEDALIGSLTVRETMDFAARLALTGYDVFDVLPELSETNTELDPLPRRNACVVLKIFSIALVCALKQILSLVLPSRKVSAVVRRNDWVLQAD